MKILHTADWHLGKRLEHIDRFEEQTQVLNEICTIVERLNIDLVLLAGDVFDTFNPSKEAKKLFYKTLRKLSNEGKRPIVVIAGNHDSPNEIELLDEFATEDGIFLIGKLDTVFGKQTLDSGIKILNSEGGFLELLLPQHSYPVRILTTPYVNETRLKTHFGTQNPDERLRELMQTHWQNLSQKYCNTQGVNLLMSHAYVMKKGGQTPIEHEGENALMIGNAQPIFSLNLPQNIQYAALGHLHEHQTIDTQPTTMVYSGSPLGYSFSEAGQQKKVVVVDIEPNQEIEINAIDLKKGRQIVKIQFDNVIDATDYLTQNTDKIVELSLNTSTTLTAQDKQTLEAAHSNLIIIPSSGMAHGSVSLNKIDLSKPIEALFEDYFNSKNNGKQPNQAIKDLFLEILNTNLDEHKEN